MSNGDTLCMPITKGECYTINHIHHFYTVKPQGSLKLHYVTIIIKEVTYCLVVMSQCVSFSEN